MKRIVSTAVSTTVILIAAAAQSPQAATPDRQFSYVRPWTVMKRSDGTCYAYAQAFHGDHFVLNFGDDAVHLSLVNERFDLPPGEYPVGFSIQGATIGGADTTLNGVVADGLPTGITIAIHEGHVRDFLRASLLTVNLAGNDHLLFLSDTASMARDMAVCEAFEGDPLESAR